MECWAARSGNKEAVVEFSVTDLGFQGCFSAGLDAELSFCLHSISPFHKCPPGMVVTRTFSDERTDGRTDGRTIGRWPRGRPWLGRTVASFLKLPGGKTAVSARMHSRPRGREHASRPWMPRDYIRGLGSFHSHFLRRLGLEKLQCVWCTSWSGLW
jgi:hypothetical protein